MDADERVLDQVLRRRFRARERDGETDHRSEAFLVELDERRSECALADLELERDSSRRLFHSFPARRTTECSTRATKDGTTRH
jgi:hypothetical protein